MNHLLKDESSQYYRCGYSCDNAIVLSCGEEHFFITDSRYTTEALEAVNCHTSVIEASDLAKAARELIRKNNIRSLLYDPGEWKVSDFKKIESKLPRLSFKAKPGHFAALRAVKSDEEVLLLQEAAAIGAKAFESFGAFLSSNDSQLSEKRLFYKASGFLTGEGERDLSFEPILAVNENAAKPHALPTGKKLNTGDLLLMDAGIKHKRYCSDRTRTVQAGRGLTFETTQRFDSQKIQKAYDLVLKAHDEAIAKARVGMRAGELDKIARDVIEKGGYGERFIHSLGHGVGLDIHEYPFLNKRSDMILEPNMVFTIEPGIYIPGEFGIRIEDMVVLHDDGARIL